MALKEKYLQLVSELLNTVSAANRTVIEDLGPKIAATLAEGGVLHLFGSGHSKMVAMEIERRAGGLVPISSIEDPTPGWAEQVSGFGTRLFERYDFQYRCRPGDYLVVVSNSGKNHSPLEVAWAAKKKGMKVVALTSIPMSAAAKSQHESGLRLFEMADTVLDNRGEPGDAALPLPDDGMRVGPTSTFSGAILLNLLNLEIIDALRKEGHALPLLKSQNLPGGKTHNEALAETYRDRIRRPI